MANTLKEHPEDKVVELRLNIVGSLRNKLVKQAKESGVSVTEYCLPALRALADDKLILIQPNETLDITVKKKGE